MDPEKARMTREAWRKLEKSEDCARSNHEPTLRIATTMADPIGFMVCDCGDVTWTPSRWREPVEESGA